MSETARLIASCREPDVVGEALRALTFPGHDGEYEFGCYTTFSVRPDAEALPEPARAALVSLSLWDGWALCERASFAVDEEDADQVAETNAMADGYRYHYGDLEVEAAWFWDGDGWLCFRVFGPMGHLCGVVNDDAKKPRNWRSFHVAEPLPGA